MKKWILVSMIFLSGCGLKMVKKSEILDGLKKAQNEVNAAQSELCSDEYKQKLDNTFTLIQSLINQFE